MNSDSNLLENNQEFFEQIAATCDLHSLQLNQLFPGIEKQRVEVGAVDPYQQRMNAVEILYVCAIARHLKAAHIFEFGTYLGRTTFHLACGSQVERVFTLDLQCETIPEESRLAHAEKNVQMRQLQGIYFRGHPISARITQLFGDSRSFDFSAYFKTMDFIFIDGSTESEILKSDVAQAINMLKKGGTMVISHFSPRHPGVIQFIKEFSKTHPLFWIRDTGLLVYCDQLNPKNFTIETPPYARSIIKPD